MRDSFDKELEMELDDNRLAALLTAQERETRADDDIAETLDRPTYFKELFHLQHELVRLQDWVVA